MLTVADVWEDAGEILGDCNEVVRYRTISDAIELLANKGEWDPLRGYVDICCSGRYVTLPPEVETPIAVLIDGQPSLANDQLFHFHLNGPGADWNPCGFAWMDQGLWPTFQDLPGPRRIFAFSTDPADIGQTITIYGEDSAGSTLKETSPAQDGMVMPIQYGSSALTSVSVNRIRRIVKPVTAGRVKIASSDYSNATCNASGTLIADMQYWETVPQYRRIMLSQAARSVRVFFRRKTHRVGKQTDLIPLHSRFALVAMIQAVRAYRRDNIELGLTFEAQATRWLSEKEMVLQPPGGLPIQVDIRGGLYNSKTDDFGYD